MLNKQGDNIQPWSTPFPILNHSTVPGLVLTVDSWTAFRFHRRQIRLSGIPLLKNFPKFVVIHTVKGFSIFNEAQIDNFLEFYCFFYDAMDVGNLISIPSVFSKSILNIWKFLVHIPRLENFEYYFASMWNKCKCDSLNILWHSLSLVLEWKLIFSSPVATAELSKFAGLLSAALSQHHLWGIEITQLEFHHIH